MNKSLASRLFKLQAELPHVPKNRTANIGKFSYKYADLESLMKAVLPLFQKHGLLISQCGHLVDGKNILRTAISLAEESADGALICDFLLPESRDPQEIGGAITYYRRYALCAMIGLVAEDDTDAQPKKDSERYKPHAEAGIEPKVTDKQLKRMFAIQKKTGVSDETLKAWAAEMGVSSRKDLTRSQYDTLIVRMEGGVEA